MPVKGYVTRACIPTHVTMVTAHLSLGTAHRRRSPATSDCGGRLRTG